MNVLIVSANSLPASPSGPAYLAGAARAAGHTVDVFESLFAVDVATELAGKLAATQPDVVGVSIRLVHGDVQDPGAPLGTRHLDLRPRVKEIVATIRQNSGAKIVLGHVAPVPWEATAAAGLLAGKPLTAANAEAAAAAAVEGAKPLSGNAYKVTLARTAVKRALLAAAQGRA